MVTARNTHVRFWIIAVLFVVSSINFASRGAMGIAGQPLQAELHLSNATLGYIFSAFGWSYVIGQIPGGALLDRYGSRPVYLWSIGLWALFTGLQAFVSSISFVPVVISLFALRLALGFAECPSFPANARIVANWFPHAERGTASAIFNSSQYFSVVAFAPLMGWLAQYHGWRSVFLAMGLIGLFGAALFWRVVQSPSRHPHISRQEYDYIEANGALVNLDRPAAAPQPINWGLVGQLLRNRMLLGIYLAQYCINALTYFYTTWFAIYLVQARHMTLAHAGFAAAAPALAGWMGGILGGIISDLLLKRGVALSAARKIPILVGLVISCAILVCNYTDSQALIMTFMAIAFFGKGVAALGWAVMSDAAPREATGLSGSIFNLFGNVSGIVTPIGIGYILDATGSWDGALVFVFAHSIVAMISYGFITGRIRRVVLQPPAAG